MAIIDIYEAQAFHEPADGGNESRLEVIVDFVGDEIEAIAPVPADDGTPEYEATLTDYNRRRRNAELMLFAYFWDTGGTLSSKSGRLGGKGWKNVDELRKSIERSLGPFFAGESGSAAGSSNKITIVEVPWQ